jgi:molybdopterin molybdotransferase
MNKKPLTKSLIFNLLKKIRKNKIGNEEIILINAKNRILAKDINSKINLPPFNNSAVDGYAIHKNDLNKTQKLLSTQRIAAGDKLPINLKKGEVARIFTGACMPANCKTIIMQENVTVKDKHIRINKIPTYGENCRLAGEDIAKGSKAFSQGDKINTTNINLIAAIGKHQVTVKKKLKIGYYTSGNELKKPTEKLCGSQINNSNHYSLHVLLDYAYLESKYLGILRDTKKFIIKSFLKNINKYDVLITTGGASVGEEDHLITIIQKLGKIFFWKAAIKPGRPLAIGKIQNTFIICLPGNPVSVHLLYGMIVKPFLEFLCGAPLIQPRGIKATAMFSMKKKNKRMEWLRVNIIKNSENLSVNRYYKQGSGMISSMVFSDGILEIPENISYISRGDRFIFYSFKELFN